MNDNNDNNHENTTISRKLGELTLDAGLSSHEGLDEWLLGEAFAFCHEAPQPILFLGSHRGGTIDVGHHSIDVSSTPIALPPLLAVFTDKDLYREGDDRVRVVVWSPADATHDAPNGGPYRNTAAAESLDHRGTVELRVEQGGLELSRQVIDVDSQGLGLWEMPDPVAGEYELHLGNGSTRFTVAAYELAPLTARFESIELRERGGRGERQELRYVATIETYGAPFTGDMRVTLMDLSESPPTSRGKARRHCSEGRLSADQRLVGEGPFALQLQAIEDPMKTATLPLPGSRREERDALELSAWGTRRTARLVPFEFAELQRGLWVHEDRKARTTAPLKIVEVTDDEAVISFRADIEAWSVITVDPQTGRTLTLEGGAAEAGETLFVPIDGPWTLVLAGVLSLGTAWEGRAAVLTPAEGVAEIDAPEQVEPGDTVTLEVRGPGGASAFVLVKDARLQTADTSGSSTAAALRRQIVEGLSLCADGQVTDTIQSLMPAPCLQLDEAMAFGAAMDFEDDFPFDRPAAAAPGGRPRVALAAPGAPMQAVRKSRSLVGAASGLAGVMSKSEAVSDDCCDAPSAQEQEETPATVREDFIDVAAAEIVRLDEDGRATLDVQLGDAMGSMQVDVMVVDGLDVHVASRQVLVTRDLFGEFSLPRYVRSGDWAEGALVVRVAEGAAEVEVRRDGVPVVLHRCGEESSPTLAIAAPGATVRFTADPGEYEATVRNESATDRSTGTVEEPGKLVWLQRAVRLLQPGDELSLDNEPEALSLEVLPSLDKVFDRMVGGLMSYEHCCCEQTSAIMLAAAAAWITAPDEQTKRDAATHIRGCVAREKRMHLPGRGFKGWPDMPNDVFVYSPGATLNLLQMKMLRDFPLDGSLSKALDECLEMARDAAKAHGLDPAPAKPSSAREAYGRFTEYAGDRERMARFVVERIEPWTKRRVPAILKFRLPSISSETYHRSPAMVRSETAYGAATLIEMGGEYLKQGLDLANTVLDAIGEGGRLYSTLDSVAALTLLAAMRRAKLHADADAECRVDGSRTTVADALARGSELRSIEAINGPLQVQVTRLVEESYADIDDGTDVQVSLERRGRKVRGSLSLGDQLELVVKVKGDVEAGDLVHVFLPASLSWVHGGGQVKRFSLDLQDQPTFRVPLAATGLTLSGTGEVSRQRFAVALRNMYDEERGKGFDDLEVTVAHAGTHGRGGLASKVWQGIKAMMA